MEKRIAFKRLRKENGASNGTRPEPVNALLARYWRERQAVEQAKKGSQ